MAEKGRFISIIGGANLDIHGSPTNPLRYNDSNPGTVESSPGGVARNIAENLARLGNDSRLIAPVGNDHYGRMLVEQGQSAGIDMQHILRIDTARTSTYLSILDENGELVAAINDMAILDHLGADALHAHRDMLDQATIILIDTNLKEDALAFVMDHFGNRTIFVDTVSCAKANRIAPHLQAVHTLKPSLPEAEELTGMTVESTEQLPELANWFHHQGVKRLFISLGTDGIFYSAGSEQGIENAIVASDITVYGNGAGDALFAGLAHAWIRDWPLMRSIRFALCTAYLTISHPATIYPEMSEAAVTQIYETTYV